MPDLSDRKRKVITIMPHVSDDVGTLYEHCVRAITHGLRFGSHGLPLMGCGDWNDGMNLVGEHGKGESVWLAFFLFEVLNCFAATQNSKVTTPSPKSAWQKRSPCNPESKPMPGTGNGIGGPISTTASRSDLPRTPSARSTCCRRPGRCFPVPVNRAGQKSRWNISTSAWSAAMQAWSCFSNRRSTKSGSRGLELHPGVRPRHVRRTAANSPTPPRLDRHRLCRHGRFGQSLRELFSMINSHSTHRDAASRCRFTKSNRMHAGGRRLRRPHPHRSRRMDLVHRLRPVGCTVSSPNPCSWHSSGSRL